MVVSLLKEISKFTFLKTVIFAVEANGCCEISQFLEQQQHGLHILEFKNLYFIYKKRITNFITVQLDKGNVTVIHQYICVYTHLERNF